MNANDFYHLCDDLWRQFPRFDSTFSPCSNGCGDSARGGSSCANCTEKEIAKLIGRGYASKYRKSIETMRSIERRAIADLLHQKVY